MIDFENKVAYLAETGEEIPMTDGELAVLRAAKRFDDACEKHGCGRLMFFGGAGSFTVRLYDENGQYGCEQIIERYISIVCDGGDGGCRS